MTNTDKKRDDLMAAALLEARAVAIGSGAAGLLLLGAVGLVAGVGAAVLALLACACAVGAMIGVDSWYGLARRRSAPRGSRGREAATRRQP